MNGCCLTKLLEQINLSSDFLNCDTDRSPFEPSYLPLTISKILYPTPFPLPRVVGSLCTTLTFDDGTE